MKITAIIVLIIIGCISIFWGMLLGGNNHGSTPGQKEFILGFGFIFTAIVIAIVSSIPKNKKKVDLKSQIEQDENIQNYMKKVSKKNEKKGNS